MLARQLCVQNSYTNLYRNPTDGLVADTGSKTDGWTELVSTSGVLFSLGKEQLKPIQSFAEEPYFRALRNYPLCTGIILDLIFDRKTLLLHTVLY
jgi:hypothetical protein